MSEIKLVILMRTDLNMRKGKMIAQAAHAVLGVYRNFNNNYIFRPWEESGERIITLQVSSLDQLYAIYNNEAFHNIPKFFQEDSGKTEFHGIKTITSAAIGPAFDSVFESVTKILKLL